MLDAVCAGDGAGDVLARRRAFAAYRRFGPEARPLPRRWRHDYTALDFADLVWSTGAIRVPAAENAAGLVHAGSTFLQTPSPGDARLTLRSLAGAEADAPQAVAAVRGQIVPYDADRFVALATAFRNCGAFVDVPEGVVLDAPIQLVWTARPGPPSAVYPHIVVRVGAGARATIVERHVGESESLVAGIVEIDVGAGAHLDYVVLQQTDGGARTLFRRGVRCAAGAVCGVHVAELGSALCRSVLDISLPNDGARAETNALFFANGFANVDLAISANHDAPGTCSDTLVRSAAGDRAAGRFTGSVHIGPNAHDARAAMRDDALVLSRNASLEAEPALEIDAHDVAVSHAASVGALDEEQLFYVQTRGIARSAAERMVALAFFEPAIARFPSDALRDEIRAALDVRLDEVPDTFQA